MNLLKLLTKSGRQSLVRDAITEYASPAKIAELTTDFIARALEAGAEKLSEERRAEIAMGCERGGTALIHLTAAVAPQSEDGAKVSPGERAIICSDVRACVTTLVTQRAVDEIVEKVVGYVP